MRTLTTLVALVVLVACQTPDHASYYGAKIDRDDISDLDRTKTALASTGQVETKLEGKVLSTCSVKGCWMKVATGEDTLMVKFKDYAFFVPKEGQEGKQVIFEGLASYDTLSVAQLKHYAHDAGKSEDEIAKISEPEYLMTFTASGVIIEQ